MSNVTDLFCLETDFFNGPLSSLVLGKRFKLVVGTKMDFEPWLANEVLLRG